MCVAIYVIILLDRLLVGLIMSLVFTVTELSGFLSGLSMFTNLQALFCMYVLMSSTVCMYVHDYTVALSRF